MAAVQARAATASTHAFFKIYDQRFREAKLVVSQASPGRAGLLVLPEDVSRMICRSSLALARVDARQRLVDLLGPCPCATYKAEFGVRDCPDLSEPAKDEVLSRLARGVVCGVDRKMLCPEALFRGLDADDPTAWIETLYQALNGMARTSPERSWPSSLVSRGEPALCRPAACALVLTSRPRRRTFLGIMKYTFDWYGVSQSPPEAVPRGGGR